MENDKWNEILPSSRNQNRPEFRHSTFQIGALAVTATIHSSIFPRKQSFTQKNISKCFAERPRIYRAQLCRHKTYFHWKILCWDTCLKLGSIANFQEISKTYSVTASEALDNIWKKFFSKNRFFHWFCVKLLKCSDIWMTIQYPYSTL